MLFSPKISFSLKIILISLFLTIIHSCNKFKRSDESNLYINEPKVGDVYFYEVSKGKYSLMKIASIENNRVSFKMNALIIDKIRFIDETENSVKYKRVPSLNEDRYFTDSIQVHKREELIEKYSNKIIYEILRE